MEEEWDAVMGMLEIMSLESQEEYHKQKLADLKAKNTSL